MHVYNVISYRTKADIMPIFINLNKYKKTMTYNVCMVISSTNAHLINTGKGWTFTILVQLHNLASYVDFDTKRVDDSDHYGKN